MVKVCSSSFLNPGWNTAWRTSQRAPKLSEATYDLQWLESLCESGAKGLKVFPGVYHAIFIEDLSVWAGELEGCCRERDLVKQMELVGVSKPAVLHLLATDDLCDFR
jgi:hypothetical protein